MMEKLKDDYAFKNSMRVNFQILLSGFERSLLHHYPPLILDEGIVPPPESFNPKI